MCLNMSIYTQEVILMKHIINYKSKDFSELLGVSIKTLQRWDREYILVQAIQYKKKIAEAEEIVKSIQSGNKTNVGTKDEN